MKTHLDESVAAIGYRSKADFAEVSSHTSVVHACFITAIARLKLYSALEALGTRVLYFDTDSVSVQCNQ